MMRYFFPAIFILFLASCSQSSQTEKDLVGQWLFVKADLRGLDTTISGAANVHANPMEEQMRGLTYEFFADKTFLIGLPPAHGGKSKPNGVYSILNDGKSIELKRNGSPPNSKNKIMNIPVLNADSLVLEEQGVKLIFLRKL